MNDRFKFRVWDNKTNSYLPSDDSGGITPNGKYIGIDIPNRKPIDLPTDFTAEQCTGLKDKNGKLVYEGDILEYQSEGEGGSDYTWKVEWNDACFCNTPSKKDVCEIIGNIRENPELMELK